MVIGSGNSAFESGGYYIKVVPVPDTNLAMYSLTWYTGSQYARQMASSIGRVLNYATDGETIYGYPEWVPYADGSSYFAPMSGLSAYWGVEQAPFYRTLPVDGAPETSIGDQSGYKKFFIYNSGWLKSIHSAYVTGNPYTSGNIIGRIGAFAPRNNVYSSYWARLQPRVLVDTVGRSGTMSGDWELVEVPVEEYAPPGESAISSTIDTHVIPSGADRNPITLAYNSAVVPLTYYALTGDNGYFPNDYEQRNTTRTVWYPTEVKYYTYTAQFELYGKGNWPDYISYTANDSTGGTFTGSSTVRQASMSNLTWSSQVTVSALTIDPAVSADSALPSSCPSLYNYTPKINYEFVGANAQVYRISGSRMAMSAWGR